MRALPALVVVVAATVAPLASGGCYTVPALEDAGTDAAIHAGDGSGGGSGGGSGSNSGSSSGSGASSSSSSGASSDASPHGDAGPCTGGILCACMNAMDCETGLLCAQPNTFVGQAIFTAANIGGGNGFCTKGCCSSQDCPTGSVCWASGEGGQYCVDPTWLGRSKPTSNRIGGAMCASGADCLSGLCVGGACADTCCSYRSSSSECTYPGATCAFGVFPGKQGIDSHFAPHCGPASGATQTGNPCNVNSDCQGGLCYPFGGAMGSDCTEPCRNSSDCSGNSDSYCDWDVLGGSGTDVYAACFPLGSLDGYGASCTSNTMCGSGVCNPNNCTGPCFADGDCSGGPQGWRCTPGIQLTFQTAGTYSVLSCGP